MCEIIIVDDDPQFHFITERRFLAENVSKEHRSYLDPVIALKYLMNKYFKSEVLPEIILLDINMPQISGWVILDFINNLNVSAGREPAVYIVSSSVDPGDKQKAGLYSCVKGFISKPITAQDFELIGFNS